MYGFGVCMEKAVNYNKSSGESKAEAIMAREPLHYNINHVCNVT